MVHRALADAVVFVHAAFALFVIVGGFLVLRWRRVAWVHLPAVLWGAAIEFADWMCPLTPLENWLRARAGAVSYPGGFVEHYIMPVLYPTVLTRDLQVALGIFVVVINCVVYWLVIRRSTWRLMRVLQRQR